MSWLNWFKIIIDEIRTRKEKRIDFERTLEDFDSRLDKTLDDWEKECSIIDNTCSLSELGRSTALLRAQSENTKKYQDKINEHWLKVERKLEDYSGKKDINKICWLNKEVKKKFIDAKDKKESAIKDIKNKTIDKLRLTGFSDQAINNVYNGVFKK
ncbi:MAG: hypothetical protein ACUZ77_03505 [Candidatus Brocadiales bacterium]